MTCVRIWKMRSGDSTRSSNSIYLSQKMWAWKSRPQLSVARSNSLENFSQHRTTNQKQVGRVWTNQRRAANIVYELVSSSQGKYPDESNCAYFVWHG